MTSHWRCRSPAAVKWVLALLLLLAALTLAACGSGGTAASTPSATPSQAAPASAPSATPTPIASDTPGNITGVNKGSLPVKHITLFALTEGMSQAEIDAFEAYEMDIESHGSGAFTIRNVPPGTYVLMKTSWTTTKKPFQVLPGETVDIGTIHLDRP